MLKVLVRLLFAGGFGLLGASLWLRDAPPEPAMLRPEVLEAPVQVQVRKPAFETAVGGVKYRVQPLYTYDLSGVVVSRHSSDSFIDYIHRARNDNLNVVDLCVIWGDNVRADLSQIAFSSGQFQCFWETGSEAAWKAFDQYQISNNHLLTDKAPVAKRLRDVRVGDQVRFRGYLAEYSHNHGFDFKRGTSIVRTDTGNGACETVFVEDFENLQPGGGPWRRLFWVALGLLALGVVAWLVLPAEVDNSDFVRH